MIEVQGLTKVYGTTRAVDGLDFAVGKGEIVGFLGPNGAGKSTTMRILCGALGATAGRAAIGGHDVLEQPREVKRLVGYLPEVPPLYPEMGVRTYLRYCARIKQAEEPEQRVEAVMARVGLAEVAHRLIGHLSKGFRQRVGLAQALVHAPRVLILDEPASGLDPAQRVEIRSLVRELAQGEVTVVLSTHVLSEVEAICDRVIIVHRGRIVAQDTVEALSRVGSALELRVARPGSGVSEAIRAVEGVSAVTDLGDGRFEVAAEHDVREQVAHATVGFGLLELGAQQALEDAYLALTASAEEA